VYSRASNDYVRTQNPDGSFQAETYVFKEGGNFGGPRYDASMDKLNFDDVTRVIQGPLAAQNYVASEDPATTKLIIVVFWGTTTVPNDVMPAGTRPSDVLRERASNVASTSTGRGAAPDLAANQDLLDQSRAFAGAEAISAARIDAASANILGYTDEISRTSPYDPHMVTLKDEVEHDRYYVVLLAYDYKAARRFGARNLLWETRFSIPEQGNDFEKAFPLMASIAARYFGRSSGGLVHHNLDEGHVEVGEPQSLGTVPEK
jgi:hypothetical protein